MPTTYQLIASATVSTSGVQTITLSSIPSTYTDLVLNVSLRSARTSQWEEFRIEINDNTSGIYRNQTLAGNNVNIQAYELNADTQSSYYIQAATSATVSTFGVGRIYFCNYADSNAKSWVGSTIEPNASTSASQVYEYWNGALWDSSGAISKIELISNNSYDWDINSKVWLFGIKNS